MRYSSFILIATSAMARQAFAANFEATCKTGNADYGFAAPGVIDYQCKTKSGSYHYTELDINNCINNNNGVLYVSLF